MTNPTTETELSHRIRQSVAGVIKYNRTTAGRSLATFPLDLAEEAAREIDRLTQVFEEACNEVRVSHGVPCHCKYCHEPKVTP